MKNLESYGVQEMDTREMKQTDGGFFAIIGGIIFTALAAEVIFEGSAQCWADFVEGFNNAIED